MAAPHQNIADIVVLKTSAPAPEFGDLNLESGAPVGLRLAAARKAKGLTHAEVHAGTKIKIVHIAAIETGDKAALPATPFAAGFVKAYAQFLGLDADAFARTYKEEAGFVPLAAPVKAAIVREVMQTQAVTPAAEAPPATLMTSTALVPIATLSPPQAEAPSASAAQAPSRSMEADKLVTWIGAGAAIAVVAFIAGRAAQPAAPAPVIAPAPTIIAEAAEPAPVAAEPAPVIVDPAPEAAQPMEAPPIVAEVKPPIVKPKPKPRAVVEEPPPAVVEVIPAPILVEAPVAEEPPAPAVIEPKIVPAQITRAASPEYPERCATRAGAKVGVAVIFSVTAEGRPVSATVAKSDDRCFNTAALRAVYEMRFAPRTIDGVAAIETGKTVTVQFVR